MDDHYHQIVSDLQHRRKKRGLSQEKVAERLGICPRTVSQIERGRSAKSENFVAYLDYMGYNIIPPQSPDV